MEELDFIIESSKELMDNSIIYLEKELVNIRAGKANPNMLSSVNVEYYGVMTPLTQTLKLSQSNLGRKINYKISKKLFLVVI